MERKRKTMTTAKEADVAILIDTFREAHRFTSQFRAVARLEDLLEPAIETYTAIGDGMKRLEEIKTQLRAAEDAFVEMSARVKAEEEKTQERLKQIKVEYEANISALNAAIASAQKELDQKEETIDNIKAEAQRQAQEMIRAAQAEASGAKAVVLEAAKKAEQEEKRYQNALASIGRLKERL